MEKQPINENKSEDLDLEQMLRAIRRLGLVDELHPDSEFLDLDSDYEINLSKEDGESYIQKIASQADREYEWVYDEESSLWLHRKNENTKKIVDERTGHILQHSLEVHPDFKKSKSESEVYYHLHPFYKKPYGTEQSSKKTDLMILFNQLPSPEDVTFFAESGYRKTRIISQMGVIDVTIDKEGIANLIDNPNAKRDESGELTLLDLIIDRQSLSRQIVNDGMDATIQSYLEQITSDCDGLIKYSFRKIHKT